MKCKKLLAAPLFFLLMFFGLSVHAAGNSQSGKSDDGWEMTILDEHGERLALHEDYPYPRLVVGKSYRVVGKVPPKVWHQLRDHYLVLETRGTDESDDWVAHKKITVQGNRHFDETFKVGRELHSVKDFRVRVFPKDGEPGDEDPAGVDAPASPLLTAVADSELRIRIINDTKSDWNLFLPLGSEDSQLEGYVDDNGSVVTRQCQTDCGNYDTVTQRLNQDGYADLIYTNPPVGTAIGFYGERADGCLGNCDKYVINWAHKPNNKYTACSDKMPAFASGENYYVRMTPRALSSSVDLFIWGDNTPLCSAGLDNGWGNFWDNHPTLKNVAEVVAVLTAVAVICVVAPEAVMVIGTGLEGAIEGEVVVETAEIEMEVGVFDEQTGQTISPFTGQLTNEIFIFR